MNKRKYKKIPKKRKFEIKSDNVCQIVSTFPLFS